MKQEKIWDSLYKQNLRWKLETRSLPKIFKGKKVLELGAGNGKTVKSILSQKPKELVALDFSSKALEIIKKEFPSVTCVKANLTSLPFSKDSFDIVVCYYAINNLIEKDRKKAISEIYRVLNPKGLCIFEDFSVGDFRESLSENEIEPQTFEKANGLICHFFNETEIKELFSEFNSINSKIKKSNPIKSKPQLKRKIISVVAKK